MMNNWASKTDGMALTIKHIQRYVPDPVLSYDLCSLTIRTKLLLATLLTLYAVASYPVLIDCLIRDALKVDEQKRTVL